MKTKGSLFRSLIVTAVVFMMMVVSAAPAFAESTVGLKLTVKYRQTEARKQFDMVNSARTSGSGWYWNEGDKSKTYCGKLPALTYDYQLEELAMKRAMELAVLYSHVRPDGTGIGVLNEGCVWYGIAENIAYGYGGTIDDPKTVYDLFMEETESYEGQGHRRNILSEGYTSCAMACVQYGDRFYWVQEFRNPNNDPAYRAPQDIQANGTVNILTSKIGAYEWDISKTDITLETGKSADLPTARLLAEVPNTRSADHWFEVDTTVSVSSSDTSVAKLQGTKIEAVGVGTAQITYAASAGGQSFRKSVNVTVKTPDFSNATVKLSQDTYVYDGKTKTPSVTGVELGGKLVSSSDYTVSYADNVSAGTATVLVTGKGKYSGKTAKTTFVIAPKPIEGCELVINGSFITLFNGSEPMDPSVYIISVTDMGSGLKKVTATGVGNYSGTVEKYYLEGGDSSNSGISGKITTKSGNRAVALKGAKVSLTDTNGVTYPVAVNGNTFNADVPRGSYKLTIAKSGYAARTYSIDITASVKFDVAVSLMGDVNDDGKVDISDAAMLINNINGIAPLTGYALTTADTDRDGDVTITDAVMVINQINGVSKLT